MAQIEVVRDPIIDQHSIVLALRSAAPDESNNSATFNPTNVQQTKVFGILVPILSINGIVIDYQDIRYFDMTWLWTKPTCKFKVRDRNNLFSNFNQPGNDNYLRVQLLPHVENTYKKVDLTFLISNVKLNEGELEGIGTYMLPDFTDSRFESLGYLTTYDLFDKVSLDTGLGFSTNLTGTNDDRYIRCGYESYESVLDKEIQQSEATELCVCDWWLDLWNNIVLCNMWDRLNTEDDEEDMLIWEVENYDAASFSDEPSVHKQVALFTNQPFRQQSDLYVYDYKIENNPMDDFTGNAKALSVYQEGKTETIDNYVANGDVKKNNFLKFEYVGEVYGSYNYLLAKQCRKLFMDKIRSEVVVIHIPRPQLGVMRGSQVRFVWYDNDFSSEQKQEELESIGVLRTSDELSPMLGWLREWELESPDPDRPMKINMQVSGQYTCIGQYMVYDQQTNRWDAWLYLVRPADRRPNVMVDLDEESENNQTGAI